VRVSCILRLLGFSPSSIVSQTYSVQSRSSGREGQQSDICDHSRLVRSFMRRRCHLLSFQINERCVFGTKPVPFRRSHGSIRQLLILLFSVYEQIENLSKVPKPRRSRSFNRGNERATPVSRNSNRQQEPPSSFVHQNNPVSLSRISSDTSAQVAGRTSSPTAPRHSFEKPKGLKAFTSNSKSSTERNTPDSAKGESKPSHKRSNSVLTYEDSEAGSEVCA
jgi:hypothetical protein